MNKYERSGIALMLSAIFFVSQDFNIWAVVFCYVMFASGWFVFTFGGQA